MKNTFFLIIGLVFIVGCIYLFLQSGVSTRQVDTVTIGNTTIRVEISDTEKERIQGLSGRSSLQEGSGMLFVFENPGRHGIWMKDTRFSIDIAWISDEMKIIWIEKEVSPDTFPQVFYPEPVEGLPSTDALYILEVPAETFEKAGVDTGDEVMWTD